MALSFLRSGGLRWRIPGTLDRLLLKPTMHNILLNQLTEKGQLYIRGNHLRLTSAAEERKANIHQDYHRQIQEFFGIEPRWVEEALSILKRQRREWGRQPQGQGLG